MIRPLLLYICVLFVQTQLLGQSKSAYLKAAEDSYVESDYYSSLLYYLEAHEFDTTAVDITRAVAETARKAHVYRTAELYYQRLLDMPLEQQNNEDSFWLAFSKHKQGKYEEARKLYSIYLTENADEDLYLTRRAEKEIKSCEWALSEISSPRDNIEIERLGDDVNNVEFADFAPAIDGDDLVFSSLRYRNPATKNRGEQLVSKRLQSNQTDYVDEIYSSLNQDDLFVGHTVTNDIKSKIYYTLCSYHSGYNITCDLYLGIIENDGSITQTIKLQDPINQVGSTSTQPAYYKNKKSGEERLYFVSDRPGGEGGYDIWYIGLDNLSDSTSPINVSEINTADNDITPFYHPETDEMYFSSDGYLGLGGYDIYKMNLSQEIFENPAHLGSPINSSYNDLYFVLNDGGNEAYFSTNRFKNESHNNDTEPCCYDIYRTSVNSVLIQLNAKTFVSETSDSLPYATVNLFDLHTGDLLKNLTPYAGIDHIFELSSDNEYEIIGRKKGYAPDTIRVSTMGMYETKEIERNLFLEQEFQDLEITVFDEFTFEPLTGTTIILKNIDDPSAKDLVFNNTAEFTKADIDPNSTYEVTIKKEGYEDQTFRIYPGTDFDGNTLRRKVYMKPILFGIYLPTLLYFDNDRPGPRSQIETTEKSYSELYQPYVERKPVFIRQIKNSKAYTGDKQTEMDRLDSFFENDVKGGYATFQKFLDAVHEEIRKGFGFEILIKGFTSPLAQSDYNKKLGKRRVNSILNEIRSYQNNVLSTYIESGLLKLTDVSYGEDLAPSSIIDNPSRPAESIYSTDASKERRVEIIEVRRIFKNRNSQ